MSRVLLINSPLFAEKQNTYDEDSLPPIGLGYIGTHLRRLGHDVRLLDAVAQNLTVPEILHIIREARPDVVAVNIFTTNYTLTRTLIESIPDPSIRIFVGGLSTRTLYKEIFAWDVPNQMDVVFGDGELIMGDLIADTVSELPHDSAPGRRFFLVGTSSVYFVRDIASVPLDRDIFVNEPSDHPLGFREARLITSRGCIYNCTFCASARSGNRDLAVREMDEGAVSRELRQIREQYPNVTHIRVLDDLFLKNSYSVARATRIFQNLDFKWRAMAHFQTVVNVGISELTAMYRTGCRELFVGIESGSPDVLRKINKPHDLERVREGLGRLLEAGIGLKAYFILGFPGEKARDFEMTYELAEYLKDRAGEVGTSFRTSVFQFRPYHGTQLYYEIQADARMPHNVTDVHLDRSLSALVGRAQFNFESGNYSDEPEETVRDFIARTMALRVPGRGIL